MNEKPIPPDPRLAARQAQRDREPQTTVAHDCDVTRIVYEPGNATRYEAVACLVPGLPGTTYLVAFPLVGTCGLFALGSYVALGYMAEKCGVDRNGREIGDADLVHMAHLAALLIDGTSG